MTVTSRDRKLIETISQYGLMSTTQIRNRFFQNAAITAARRRLRKLETKKYLQRVEGCKDGLLGWAVTLRAARDFGLKTIRTRFNKNCIDHDLAISELRLRMEARYKVHHWIADHQLKASLLKHPNLKNRMADAVPDGLFSIETNAGPRVVALEMELTRKSKARYYKIFERYDGRKNLHWVWYVVGIESLGRTIESYWKEFGSRSEISFGYSVLSQLQNHFEASEFIQCSTRFPLRKVFVPRAPEQTLAVSPPVLQGNTFDPPRHEPAQA